MSVHRGGGGEWRRSEMGEPRPRRSNIETRNGWSGFRLCGLHPIKRGSAAGSRISRLILLAHRPATRFPSASSMVHVSYDLPVRLHACSPPRLAATQLARSAVLNRLTAPTGLSPALTPASRAH